MIVRSAFVLGVFGAAAAMTIWSEDYSAQKGGIGIGSDGKSGVAKGEVAKAVKQRKTGKSGQPYDDLFSLPTFEEKPQEVKYVINKSRLKTYLPKVIGKARYQVKESKSDGTPLNGHSGGPNTVGEAQPVYLVRLHPPHFTSDGKYIQNVTLEQGKRAAYRLSNDISPRYAKYHIPYLHESEPQSSDLKNTYEFGMRLPNVPVEKAFQKRNPNQDSTIPFGTPSSYPLPTNLPPYRMVALMPNPAEGGSQIPIYHSVGDRYHDDRSTAKYYPSTPASSNRLKFVGPAKSSVSVSRYLKGGHYKYEKTQEHPF